MPRFAANLTMLFNELPFLERFEAAAKAGFQAVEYLFPYEHEVGLIVDALRRHGLVQVLHNLPAGNWAAGERGIACLPGREEEFRAGVEAAIRYATALGCTRLNCLAGIALSGFDREQIERTLIDNLRFAAARLRASGIRLLIEPVNTRDIPGFFLTGTRQARQIIEACGSDNLRIQYDVYHAQIMEGDLAHTIAANFDLIEHVQIADNPGRHEPGTGEINYRFLFRHLDTLGYAGWVGCEYKPRRRTFEGLDWLAAAAGNQAAA